MRRLMTEAAWRSLYASFAYMHFTITAEGRAYKRSAL